MISSNAKQHLSHQEIVLISSLVGNLFAVDEDAVGQRLLVLGAGLASLAAEDELGAQSPLLGHVPLLLDLAVDDGVVVLEVGAEALGLEAGPQRELVHGGGVLGPGGEVLSVKGELALELLDRLGVLKEEDLFPDRLCQLRRFIWRTVICFFLACEGEGLRTVP